MQNVPSLEYYLSQPPHPNRIKGGKRILGFQRLSTVNSPLVSIITVVRNSDKYLEKTILSIFKQTYNNVEYIIIDGNSSDKTLDIVRKYNLEIDYWLSEPDRGIYDAMNKGIAQASGEIIGIVNAGDYFLPETLELVVASYKSNVEKTNIIAGTTQVVTKHGFRFDFKPAVEKLSKRMSVPHPSLFVPLNIYKTFGLYSTNYRIVSDYDFLLRVRNHVSFTCVPEILTCMAPLGASSNYFIKISELHFARISNGANYLQSWLLMIISSIVSCIRLVLEKLRLWSFAEKSIYSYIYGRNH